MPILFCCLLLIPYTLWSADTAPIPPITAQYTLMQSHILATKSRIQQDVAEETRPSLEDLCDQNYACHLTRLGISGTIAASPFIISSLTSAAPTNRFIGLLGGFVAEPLIKYGLICVGSIGAAWVIHKVLFKTTTIDDLVKNNKRERKAHDAFVSLVMSKMTELENHNQELGKLIDMQQTDFHATKHELDATKHTVQKTAEQTESFAEKLSKLTVELEEVRQTTEKTFSAVTDDVDQAKLEILDVRSTNITVLGVLNKSIEAIKKMQTDVHALATPSQPLSISQAKTTKKSVINPSGTKDEFWKDDEKDKESLQKK